MHKFYYRFCKEHSNTYSYSMLILMLTLMLVRMRILALCVSKHCIFAGWVMKIILIT